MTDRKLSRRKVSRLAVEVVQLGSALQTLLVDKPARQAVLMAAMAVGGFAAKYADLKQADVALEELLSVVRDSFRDSVGLRVKP